MIRVFLVDPDAASSAFIAAGLLGNPWLKLVGRYDDTSLPLLPIYDSKADIVLVHVGHQRGVHLDNIQQLRRQLRTVGVLLYGDGDGSNIASKELLDVAKDFVTRTGRSPEDFRNEVIVRTRTLFPKRGGPMESLAHWNQWEARLPPPTPIHKVGPKLVVIAGSTGSPQVLKQLLVALPSNFLTPIACVIHMLPAFVNAFAVRLNSLLDREVAVAATGRPIKPYTVSIAPGDMHLEVMSTPLGVQLHVNDGPPQNFVRPSADVLFRSCAANMGKDVLAVVLSGMGCDGLIGAAQIRAQGGHVMVQDQSSSVVWGMPGAIAEAGLADEIVHSENLARRLRYHCVSTPSTTQRIAQRLHATGSL